MRAVLTSAAAIIGLAVFLMACTVSRTVVDEVPYVEFNSVRYFAGLPNGLVFGEEDLQPVGQPNFVSFEGVDANVVYRLIGVDPNAILVIKTLDETSPYLLLTREGVFPRPPGGARSSNAVVVPPALLGLCQYAAPTPFAGDPHLEGC
jgi:hypothetical protein